MNDDPSMVNSTLANGPVITDQRIRDRLRDELEARLGLDQHAHDDDDDGGGGSGVDRDLDLLKEHSGKLAEIFTLNPHLVSALHVRF